MRTHSWLQNLRGDISASLLSNWVEMASFQILKNANSGQLSNAFNFFPILFSILIVSIERIIQDHSTTLQTIFTAYSLKSCKVPTEWHRMITDQKPK